MEEPSNVGTTQPFASEVGCILAISQNDLNLFLAGHHLLNINMQKGQFWTFQLRSNKNYICFELLHTNQFQSSWVVSHKGGWQPSWEVVLTWCKGQGPPSWIWEPF